MANAIDAVSSIVKRLFAVILVMILLIGGISAQALDPQTEANHFLTTMINAAEYAHFDRITVNEDFTEFIVIVNDANTRTLEEADIAATLYDIAREYSKTNVPGISVDYMNWVGDTLATESFDGSSTHNAGGSTRSTKSVSSNSSTSSNTYTSSRAKKQTTTITTQVNTQTSVSNETVWIPTNGGKKYHSRSSCSKMKNPIEVTKSEAISMGFGRCSKCW